MGRRHIIVTAQGRNSACAGGPQSLCLRTTAGKHFSGRLLLLFLTVWCFTANAQVFYKVFYPERELLSGLQRANTATGQMEALGLLGKHYKAKFRDSLSLVYVQRIHNLASASNDRRLVARALWWDAYVSTGITAYDETQKAAEKALILLHYSKRNSLWPDAIAANLLLADINVHKNLEDAEGYAAAARRLLNGWKIDSTNKDSLKLEVAYRLAHVFIHKREGEKAAQILLEFQEHVRQNRSEAIQMQALNGLAQFYLEWPGQEENARQWAGQLYERYKTQGQNNRLFIVAYILAEAHLRVQDTAAAVRYLKEAVQLQEQLETHTVYAYWMALQKRSLGLLDDDGFIRLLNNGFNNRLFLPPALIDLHTGAVYMKRRQLDSAGLYFSRAKREKMDSLGPLFSHYDYLPADYLLRKKEYGNAVAAFNELKRKGEVQGNRDKVLTALMGLSQAYAGLSEYETSNALLNRYHEIKDSLNNRNYNAKIAFLETQKQKMQLQNERMVYNQLLRRQWFYGGLLLASLLVTGAFIGFRYRLRQLRLKDQLEQENTERRLQEAGYQKRLNEATFAALRSQMNPHFVFNALNTIQSFIYANDKRAAGKYLGKFSDLMRRILDYSQRHNILLTEELELVELYTDIEKARFGSALTVDLRIDPVLEDANLTVPPLLVQPYVENAIKHGLLHKQGEKRLLISADWLPEEQQAHITVDDNGIGRGKSAAYNKTRTAHRPFASAANEKRIALVNAAGSQRIELDVVDKVADDGSSAGTTVVLRLSAVRQPQPLPGAQNNHRESHHY